MCRACMITNCPLVSASTERCPGTIATAYRLSLEDKAFKLALGLKTSDSPLLGYLPARGNEVWD